MTWAGTTETTEYNAEPSWMETAVSVVETSGLGAMGAQVEAQGYLWVQLGAPGPQHRGRLGLYIEECIEGQLEMRGALPPGIQASTGLDASLSDQLYRARLVEMRGIALGIPSLEGITNLGRTLDAEDSGVLRWWLAATAERPVRVVLSSQNMRLRVYPSPVLFESLFDVAPVPVSPRAPSVSMAESAQTMELSDLPPSVSALDSEDDSVSFADEPSPEELEEAGLGLVSAQVELPELDRALGLVEEVEQRDPAAFVDSEAAVEERKDTLVSEVASSAPSEELPPRKSWLRGAALDAEEFLRVLEEDSRRSSPPLDAVVPEEAPRGFAPVASDLVESELAGEESVEQNFVEPELHAEQASGHDFVEPESIAAPVVESIEEEIVAASREVEPSPVDAVSHDEPSLDEEPFLPVEASPLPTKVIRRAPFIRMAEPEIEEEPELEEERIAIAPSAPEAQATQFVAVEAESEPVLDESDPFVQLARREWKTWVKNLDAARGPKPLAVVERMFVTDYTRLREAVRRGVADQSATQVLDAWQESFSTSYSEAFDSLRVRGKRPTMVLDVPELAQRLGRLQGARRVQLLLVDGLRFDLGLMVQERLRTRVDAALTERLLLWSALPSITTYQLELLGKGAEGLRESCNMDESPALVARGRAALAPRRIRTGRLELFKIDVVEDSLREGGVPVLQRLPEIAERTAVALADHLSKQSPRTLVLVFGDHGFALDPKAAGTTAEVRQGGSSPEEVLVPAFAWLTGAVH